MTYKKEYLIWVNIPMRESSGWHVIEDKIASIMEKYGMYDGGGTDFDTRDIFGYVTGKTKSDKCMREIRMWMQMNGFTLLSISASPSEAKEEVPLDQPPTPG